MLMGNVRPDYCYIRDNKQATKAIANKTSRCIAYRILEAHKVENIWSQDHKSEYV